MGMLSEAERAIGMHENINGVYLTPSEPATIDPTIRVHCAKHGNAAATLIGNAYGCFHCNPRRHFEESYIERKMHERRANPIELI